MNNRDGLYVLQDGTHADPVDVSRGNDGVLRHKNGMAVCLYADGRPQTIGEDAKRHGNVEAAKVGVDVAPAPDVAPPRPHDVDRRAEAGPVLHPAGAPHAAPLAEAIKPAATDHPATGAPKPVDAKVNHATEAKPAPAIQPAKA